MVKALPIFKTGKGLLFAALIVATFPFLSSAIAKQKVSPTASPSSLIATHLTCELWTEPLGIDVSEPGFGYQLLVVHKNDRALRQTAYQVMVSSTSDFKQDGNADQWNSGKISSSKTSFIKYHGKPLESSKKYWWRVRVWDQAGKCSAWSNTATFTMGILHEKDWKANWISAAGAEKFAATPFGYRVAAGKSDSASRWVQVDLGQINAISRVSLAPMFYADRAGWGFPVRFKVQAANDPDFKNAITIADHTSEDFKNPGFKPVHIDVKNIKCRYVRVTATTLRNEYFALRQIEVLNDGKNIASGKIVTAPASDENEGWAKQNLTDRPPDLNALPNYNSMLLRKQFSAKAALVRAVIHVSGLSQYQLSINGHKTGDYLLTPGWTNYKKTVLYDTYDVTGQIRAGDNVIGLMLGNSMYNIQPDTVRYVKFLNSFGPAKATAQLKLEYADGSVETVITDKSWQVAPGPVTYSNVFGGEDYDANLLDNNWNNNNFIATKKWSSAVITDGPGGSLKGLSCSAPPIKAMDTLPPVKVTKIKDNLFIYDFGQNASMMPLLNVTGPRGSAVRMIPAELLGKDGLADRSSATQDGARPAWWQYTLSDTGTEKWFPAFFYQGARYLQVELIPAGNDAQLPTLSSLNDVIVHSSSTPIGNFECSDKLFNDTYKLVRWAQMSNMMSLMTDCPQREKLGWLEENHLNGPSLRYNFDMAPLFRKTMNDMADAQLPNGFIPNIAPEYFIAGPSDLSNGFRNSPEWGSSFIIVPWQQYLFSGDISLLERYYDRMKHYVSFLSGTAKDDIIYTGLGDWYDIGPKEPWGSQLTPVPYTATAIYYYDNWIMSKIAKLLGKQTDESFYTASYTRIRDAFNKKFYNTVTGRYATGSQTSNAMAVFLNLVEPANKQKVSEAIVKDVVNHQYGLTSGDVGYRFLLRALAQQGRSDVIYRMNNQSDKPGYGYQLKMGATSLTEKWDAGVGSFGSQDHFMLGQINEWFFNDLAGIGVDEEGAGFKRIIIKPAFHAGLKSVRASYTAPGGNINCEWKKANGNLTLNIIIPPNANAIVYLPGSNLKSVTEGKVTAAKARGVKFLKYNHGDMVFAIASGSYHFAVNGDDQ